ncbi:hypothetical protein QVD17_11224 [Tagetes erecta]|uniref:FBD domain-containing protein n=1 Tax=Tagetes erecta TaxID=13708 RepID=A0AAD8L094_TARER|nr:hypothetical protein QVD17_11224 [Tagetes erecta]
MDRISRLPIGIIETILCFLPIQDAARTSILSREWRYHWIKIPKLVFNEDTFQASTDDGAELSVLEQAFDKPSQRKKMGKTQKLFYAISQVLLMHQGPIHDFTLSMKVDDSCVEMDHIILHLSKKSTIKILKLDFDNTNCEYELPVSLFSLHQLAELYLEDCVLSHEPSFYDFGCLTTLNLQRIWTYDTKLLHFLSGCPSLKRLTLNSRNILFTNVGLTVVDLLKCLPLIEYLSFWFHTFEDCIPEILPKELPTTLIHLKCLRMEMLYFPYKYRLRFLFLMIRSSPNLEKLELVMEDIDWSGEEELDSFTLEDYSDTMFGHLKELEIRNFGDADYELDFVILVLARSPVLKKVTIFTFHGCDDDELSEISEILLWSPLASPVVKISVGRG